MKAPAWQTHRAAILHAAFLELCSAIEHEGAQLVAGLADMVLRLDGTPLKSPGGKARTLRASLPTLKRAWYAWEKGGRKATALLPAYKSPKHIHRMPDLLVREIQRYATSQTGGRDKHGKGPDSTWIHGQLTRRWKAGEALDGIGTWRDWWAATHPGLPVPPHAPDFPWSVKTVSRRIGSAGLRKMGNIGTAAALKHLPHMERDYSKLRRCELYTLDDVRLDLVGLDDITGRVVEIKCYILQEVASRAIAAFLLKPSDAIKAEDVDELLAYGLQAEGFGVGDGYTTHLWFERGTVACSEAAQVVLEAGSDGALKIHRTSMDQGVRWVGAAADKASGHSAGKATIESFNDKLHRRLIGLPGQRGNNNGNQPANLGVGDKEAKDPSKRRKQTLKAHAEMLGQFRTTALLKGAPDPGFKLPLLLVSQLRAAVASTIADYNLERGHGMQGFHTIPEAEVAPGIWQPISEPTAA